MIARMVGFADVLISAERVALNLLQRLSGIATLTNKYVKAVEGTGAQIVTRARPRRDCVCSNDTLSNSVADTTAGSVWTTAWWSRRITFRFSVASRGGEDCEREARLPAQSRGRSRE